MSDRFTPAPLSFWQRPFAQNELPLLASILLHAAWMAAALGIWNSLRLHPAGAAVIADPAPIRVIRDQGSVAVEQPNRAAGMSALLGDEPRLWNPAKNPRDMLPQPALIPAMEWTGPLIGYADARRELFERGFGTHAGRSHTIFTGNGDAMCIVFLLDTTGSMMSSFDALRVQMRGAIQDLRPFQSFNIILDFESHPGCFSSSPVAATPAVKRRAIEFMDIASPRGGTDPVRAIQKALMMKPDLIWALLDPTCFPDKQLLQNWVSAYAAGGKIKLNFIAFEGHDPENEAFLQSLTKQTGGTYRYLSAKELDDY